MALNISFIFISIEAIKLNYILININATEHFHLCSPLKNILHTLMVRIELIF